MKDKRIWILFSLVLMTQIGAGALLPILAPYVELRLGATPFQAMVIVAAFYGAQFLATPLLGKAADHKGRRFILILCQSGTLIAYLGILLSEVWGQALDQSSLGTNLAHWGISGGVVVLLASRIFDGITGGNISVAQAYASDISSSEERAQVLGFIGGATGIGYVIGPVFGGLLSLLGIHAPFIAVSVLTLLTLAFTLVFLRESIPSSQSSVTINDTVPVALRRVRFLVLVVAFVSILSFSALQNIFPLYGTRVLFSQANSTIPPSLGIGILLTFVGLVIAIGQLFLIKPLSKRYPFGFLVVSGHVLLTIGSASVYFTDSIAMIFLAFVPFGLGYAISLTSLQTIMSQSGKSEQQGILLGLLQSAISLGYILGPLLAGQIFDHLGLSTPFLVSAQGFMLAALLGIFLWSLTEKRPTTPTEQLLQKTIAHSYANALAKPENNLVAATGRARFAQYSFETYPVPEELLESSFGCGNPVAFSQIQEGQRVLDLGSGAGLDLILAAEKVGPQGMVYGIDMSQAMVDRAIENAQNRGYQNIQVYQGAIENLPLPNQSIDWVISNCVINLSPQKELVFHEIARVLKPGGQLMISDIVAEKLPFWVRRSGILTAACVAGAIPESTYLKVMEKAGLEEYNIQGRQFYSPAQMASVVLDSLPQWTAGFHKPLGAILRHFAKPLARRLWSLRVWALKSRTIPSNGS